MRAENLLDLLDRNQLIAPDLLEGLRARIAALPEPVSADDFAQRLVEHGVLTPALAKMLLRQLDEGVPAALPPIIDAPPPMSPATAKILSTFDRPVSPPPAPLKKEPMLPKNPVPAKPSASRSMEPPFPTARATDSDRFDHKRFSKKRKSTNPWDSKLILFGAGGLLILFLLGFFLFGSLFRRSADSLFSKADNAYQRGAYSEAIVAYTDFLDAYPTDTNAQTAKIRRALARIRILVDAKTDWIKSLDTAIVEIKSIENEPGFFEETNAELANLLPAIAMGLATEAREKTSILHAEQAEKTLKLIDEYLPRSLRPVEKLAEAQYLIDRVRRLLVQDDMLNEVKKELGQKIQAEKFDLRQVELCYDLTDSVLADHPEMANNSSFLDVLKSISENEARALIRLSGEELPKEAATIPEETGPAREAAVLFRGTVHEKISPENDAPVYLNAGGAVFGLAVTDGRPLWKRTIGEPAPGLTVSPTVVPLPATSRNPVPGVLLLDGRNWALDRLDGRTGTVLWRLPVGEPFYLSSLAADSDRACIALATHSGKLLIVLFDTAPDGSPAATANRVRGLRLPQRLTSAPLVDLARNVVYQLAERNTLYILPLDNDGQARSRYFGQEPSTVRISPFLFGSNLVVIRQRDRQSCDMDVFSPDQGIVQTIPLRGLVDAAPALDGVHLALTTDSGETRLFEQTAEARKPIRQIAQGSVGGEARRHGTVRSVVLAGKNVWIADRQLMRFQAQLTQARLLPQDSVRKDIITLSPPHQRGDVLFHSFREPGIGGAILEAVSLEKASVLWETELAEPIVLEPRSLENGVFLVLTSSGKAYRIDPTATVDRFQGTPVTQLPRGIFGPAPLGAVVLLEAGFEAWIPRLESYENNSPDSGIATTGRSVMIYDPKATEATRFRSILLPAALAARPAALAGKLLVPLTDGQLALFDPASGRPAATPFITSLSPEKSSAWSAPTVLNAKECLIYDNTPDPQGLFGFYHLSLEPDGDSMKFAGKTRIAMEAPGATSICVAGARALLVDEKNIIQVFRIGNDKEETKLEMKIPLPAPCIWGPHLVGEYFMAATLDEKLHVLTSDMKLVSTASPIPAGLPLVEPDAAVLTSHSGRIWKVLLPELKTDFTIETGVRTSVGPVRSGNTFLLSGEDGTLYRADLPK